MVSEKKAAKLRKEMAKLEEKLREIDEEMDDLELRLLKASGSKKATLESKLDRLDVKWDLLDKKLAVVKNDLAAVDPSFHPDDVEEEEKEEKEEEESSERKVKEEKKAKEPKEEKKSKEEAKEKERQERDAARKKEKEEREEKEAARKKERMEREESKKKLRSETSDRRLGKSKDEKEEKKMRKSRDHSGSEGKERKLSKSVSTSAPADAKGDADSKASSGDSLAVPGAGEDVPKMKKKQSVMKTLKMSISPYKADKEKEKEEKKKDKKKDKEADRGRAGSKCPPSKTESPPPSPGPVRAEPQSEPQRTTIHDRIAAYTDAVRQAETVFNVEPVHDIPEVRLVEENKLRFEQKAVDVAAPRDGCVKQGYLTKKGAVVKNWKERYCILTASSLQYFKSSLAQEATGSVDLLQCTVRRTEDMEETLFELVTPTRTWMFKTKSKAACDEWVDVISGQVERHQALSKTLHEGFIIKRGSKVKNWKKRWCILRATTLSYYKSKTDTKPAGQVSLSGMRLETVPRENGKGKCVSITTEDRCFLFYAETEEDTDAWAAALERRV
mmetsp:Transcript_6135/g.24734  ORF Transcript_6135/g.24734 Transcript_6135/m.24734 type:complete len:557 (-) Transcript_6135:22-1692(-)